MTKGALIALLTVTAVTPLPARQALERINPPGLSTPATYTHVVKAGKLVFLAGQVGADAQGKVAGPGMKEQFEQAMKNVQTALKAAGADLTHVTKTTIFVTSIDEFRAPEVRELREKLMGGVKPPNTLVQISRLADPAYKIEIEAIAVVP
jgi:enamine deaminase RidA (YjgF/YER057c/UK114 family)